MRHQVKGYRLNRTMGHRTSMRKTMIKQLFEHEKIQTTLAQAPLSDALEAYLRDYFAAPNQRLAEEYGLDLGCWSSGEKPASSG